MNIVDGMKHERREWNESFKRLIKALCLVRKLSKCDKSGQAVEGKCKVKTVEKMSRVWDLTASCFSVHVLPFFPLSDSESLWSERNSDWPVFQDVWPTYPEADGGMEPVLPHQFQIKRVCLWGQAEGHGLGRWLSGLCRGSRRSVLRYTMRYT